MVSAVNQSSHPKALDGEQIQLSDQTWLKIMSYCDISEIRTCMGINRSMRNLVNSLPPVIINQINANDKGHHALYRDNNVETTSRTSDLKFWKNPNEAGCRKTRLMVAAERGHLKLANALIQAGVNVNATFPRNSNHEQDEIHNLFQDRGAEVLNALTQVGIDCQRLMQPIPDSIWRLLIPAGLINQDGPNDEYNALIFAAQKGHFEVVRTLIDARANVNYVTPKKYTALFAASENGHIEVVRALIQAGADMNHYDDYGDTALSLLESRPIIPDSNLARVIELLRAAAG